MLSMRSSANRRSRLAGQAFVDRLQNRIEHLALLVRRRRTLTRRPEDAKAGRLYFGPGWRQVVSGAFGRNEV